MTTAMPPLPPCPAAIASILFGRVAVSRFHLIGGKVNRSVSALIDRPDASQISAPRTEGWITPPTCGLSDPLGHGPGVVE